MLINLKRASQQEISKLFARRALKLYQLILISFGYLPLPLYDIKGSKQKNQYLWDMLHNEDTEVGDLYMRARTALEIKDIKMVSQEKANAMSMVLVKEFYRWLETQPDIKIPEIVTQAASQIKNQEEIDKNDAQIRELQNKIKGLKRTVNKQSEIIAAFAIGKYKFGDDPSAPSKIMNLLDTEGASTDRKTLSAYVADGKSRLNKKNHT